MSEDFLQSHQYKSKKDGSTVFILPLDYESLGYHTQIKQVAEMTGGKVKDILESDLFGTNPRTKILFEDGQTLVASNKDFLVVSQKEIEGVDSIKVGNGYLGTIDRI